MKTIGFFPAHPSQLWMMKALYDSSPRNVRIQWYIRDKDVTKDLIDSFGFQYTLVSKAKKGILGNALELISNIIKFMWLSKRDNIDLWFSKYGAVNISSWLLRIRNISFNDDDADVVPAIAYTSYPFANKVLCTTWTRMSQFESNAIFYNSFHELFYLHPKRFTKNLHQALISLQMRTLPPYIIIRLSSLEAHHDVNAKGISEALLKTIIHKIECKFQVFISSEKKLFPPFTKYQLKIAPSEIHNVLAHASACIGDSQTMIAEAAVLGVPALRISSFSKKIGYLEELERRGLCKSIHPNDYSSILIELDLLFASIKKGLQEPKNKLIDDTIDPVDFFWQEILKQ